MKRFLSLLFGLSIGAAIGALLVAFFSPVTSDEFRANCEAHYRRALAAGRKASAARREELEEELRELRKQ